MLGPDNELLAWAQSGAMALTGRTDGPPLAVRGRPAGVVRDALARLAAATRQRTGVEPTLPDVGLLGERAAIAGFVRRAPRSCGGAFRLLRTSDGWCGLSLARPEDADLIPALVEGTVADDPWDTLRAWAKQIQGIEAERRFRLLGLPGAAITSTTGTERPPVLHTDGGARQLPCDRPLVIDLSSLWAGPLCTHLLTLCGAEVVKVESRTRPDGARRAHHEHFDLLHAGQSMVAVDLQNPTDVRALRRLMDSADLVVEASRPRALRALGIDAAEIVASGTSWLSITARGRDSDAVGFGDDVAAGAGLIALDGNRPVPAGDAIADPIAGVVAAAEAAEALVHTRARLIDVSMHDVAALAADGPVPEHELRERSDGWWLSTNAGDTVVALPNSRPVSQAARKLGADSTHYLT